MSSSHKLHKLLLNNKLTEGPTQKTIYKIISINENINVTRVTQIYGIYKTYFGPLYSPM